jgi:hypothetical protein
MTREPLPMRQPMGLALAGLEEVSDEVAVFQPGAIP